MCGKRELIAILVYHSKKKTVFSNKFSDYFPKIPLNQEFVDANHLNRIDFIYLTLSELYVQCLYTSLSHHNSANLPHKLVSYKNP